MAEPAPPSSYLPTPPKTTYTMRVWHGPSRSLKFKTSVESDRFWHLLGKFVDGLEQSQETGR